MEVLLEEIRQEHRKNKKVESRIRNWFVAIILSLGVGAISLFGQVMVIGSVQERHDQSIKKIERTYVNYESLMLFNKTYELQLQETQAALKGQKERVKKIQKKYRDLRTMILKSGRNFNYRGGDISWNKGK